MEPVKWALQALDIIESETRDLVPAGAPSTPKSETDVEIAPLVQQVGATSIAEIEKMIGELQEAKDRSAASVVQKIALTAIVARADNSI